MNFKDSENWTILNSIELSIKNKIEKYGTKLSDWNLSINRGILTGYNDAFIIDEATKNALIASDPKSAELIRPILRGKDIKRYSYNFANLYLICTFPSKHYNIDDYPAIKKYLLSFDKRRLAQTGEKNIDGVKGFNARKKTGNKWFETQDQINYSDDFNKQKIIYPCIMSKQPSFMLDTLGKYYTVAPGNIITGSNLDYLIGCLNSKIYYFALRKFYMGGGIEGELKTNRLLILPVIMPNCINTKSYKIILDSGEAIQDYIKSKKLSSLDYAEKIIDVELAKALDLTTSEYEYIIQYTF